MTDDHCTKCGNLVFAYAMTKWGLTWYCGPCLAYLQCRLAKIVEIEDSKLKAGDTDLTEYDRILADSHK